MPLVDVEPLGLEDLPLPMGVQAATGKLFPGLTPDDLNRVDLDPPGVLERGQLENTDFLAVAEVDPNDLTQAGWGIIFAKDASPAIREALDPLIEHRRQQVNDPKLFKIYDGPRGYQPGDTARSWLDRFSVGFAIVDPALGVPLYLAVVGSPEEIPFEFQYQLDTYWCVGRISFETVEEYAAYAKGVVDYEVAPTIQQQKQAAIFNVRNLGDRATGLLHNQLAVPLVEGTAASKPLGERQKFKLQSFLGDSATRENLSRLLSGKQPGGLPALLFTGSHGVGYPLGDPKQRERQGAIVCQDWEGGPVEEEHCFAAPDITPDSKLTGLIHFFFACYGGGCPSTDTYSRPGGKPAQITENPMVSRLPQRMLASGALASLAHIDRAWSYSFQVGRSAPQIQEFRDVMVRLLRGDRIGQATDQFNLRWTVLSAELADTLRQREVIPGQISDAVLANRWVARDDARNYLILGDPAVRLRVEAMSS